MTSQIDPLAYAVATVALAVSVWSIVIATRERMGARGRDTVRDALVAARNAGSTGASALESGVIVIGVVRQPWEST